MGEGAAGDAELIEDAEGAQGFDGGFFAGEKAGVAIHDARRFGTVFAEEFDAEIAYAEFEHFGQVFGPGLGDGVVDGIATADIGDEGMGFADAVAEIDLVVFAGASAVTESCASAEGVGKDAVLHVEHGYVLMKDAFEESGIDAGEHGGELGPVEIVAGDHADEALPGEDGGGEFVGDVEGIVANLRDVGADFVVEADGGEATDEKGVGIAVADLLEETFFARFDDAEGDEGDGHVGGATTGDGLWVTADVFEVDVDHGGASGAGMGKYGVELIEGAKEDVQMTASCRGWIGR